MTATQAREGQQFQLGGSGPEAYERYLVPIIFDPWARHLVDLVAPKQGERVLDVACGTGVVARCAATHVGDEGTVVGLDANEGMLQVARATSSGIRPGIEWRIGSATDMPLPDGSFEVVCCQQGLQFFGDRSAALREMPRGLVPAGRLALAVWRPIEFSPGFVSLTEALGRHAGADTAAMMQAPFSGGNAEELRAVVAGAGFEDVRIRIGVGSIRFPSPGEFLRQEAASSPLAEPVGALSPEVREALIRDLAESLQCCTDDDGVVFPMQTHVLTALR